MFARLAARTPGTRSAAPTALVEIAKALAYSLPARVDIYNHSVFAPEPCFNVAQRIQAAEEQTSRSRATTTNATCTTTSTLRRLKRDKPARGNSPWSAVTRAGRVLCQCGRQTE